MLAHGRPMKLADICVAIEERLGRSVSYASVEWCLRMGVRGDASWVMRVKPGWYRVRSEE